MLPCRRLIRRLSTPESQNISIDTDYCQFSSRSTDSTIPRRLLWCVFTAIWSELLIKDISAFWHYSTYSRQLHSYAGVLTRRFGIHDNALGWIQNYLSGRSQVVHASRSESGDMTLQYNVPLRSSLRSSSNCDLVVPRTSRKIGDRAFSVAAPCAWNRLLADLKLLRSTASFKSKLKSFMFHAAYTGNSMWTLECAIGLLVDCKGRTTSHFCYCYCYFWDECTACLVTFRVGRRAMELYRQTVRVVGCFYVLLIAAVAAQQGKIVDLTLTFMWNIAKNIRVNVLLTNLTFWFFAYAVVRCLSLRLSVCHVSELRALCLHRVQKNVPKYFGCNYDRFRQLFIIFGMNDSDNPCDWKIVKCPINTCKALRNDGVIVTSLKNTVYARRETLEFILPLLSQLLRTS